MAATRSCGICDQELLEDKEDVVQLNGSCGHSHHAICWVQRVVVDVSDGCPSCSQSSAGLWDAPLEITTTGLLGSKTEVVSSSLVPESESLVSRGWKAFDSLLSAGVDGTHASRLKAGLPVQELRHHGCTPEKLLDELKLNMMTFLIKNTSYSAAQLKELGLKWEHYLKGGLTEEMFPRAYDRFGNGFLTEAVLSIKNLWILCSKDPARLALLKLPAPSWKKLVQPSSVAPIVPLIEAGIRVEHFALFEYTMEEWRDEMGLTPLILQRLKVRNRVRMCVFLLN